MNFTQIFQLGQKQLLYELGFQLRRDGYTKIKRAKKFIYAEGECPVLLVAHLDTVHRELPRELFFDANQRVYWSPQGLGADDRAGVWAILQLVKFKPHILFTCDEEAGCIGAKDAAVKMFAPSVKYIIEFDRQGSNDMVFYDCYNEEFTNYVGSFGFKEQFGSFSDISALCPVWEIAGVNLSTGYYGAHTKGEYLRIDELKANIAKVRKMLKEANSETIPAFEYAEYKYSKGSATYVGYDQWLENYNIGLKKNGAFYCDYCGQIHDLKESVEEGMCKDCYHDLVEEELAKEDTDYLLHILRT
jgi:hypothetical protein